MTDEDQVNVIGRNRTSGYEWRVATWPREKAQAWIDYSRDRLDLCEFRIEATATEAKP